MHASFTKGDSPFRSALIHLQNETFITASQIREDKNGLLLHYQSFIQQYFIFKVFYNNYFAYQLKKRLNKVTTIPFRTWGLGAERQPVSKVIQNV